MNKTTNTPLLAAEIVSVSAASSGSSKATAFCVLHSRLGNPGATQGWLWSAAAYVGSSDRLFPTGPVRERRLLDYLHLNPPRYLPCSSHDDPKSGYSGVRHDRHSSWLFEVFFRKCALSGDNDHLSASGCLIACAAEYSKFICLVKYGSKNLVLTFNIYAASYSVDWGKWLCEVKPLHLQFALFPLGMLLEDFDHSIFLQELGMKCTDPEGNPKYIIRWKTTGKQL